MSVVAMPRAEADLVQRMAASFSRAGASLTGQQRRAIAMTSRRLALDPTSARPDNAVGELVWRVTAAPHTIRPGWIRSLAAAGINARAYVEILGVVARVQAIDTFCFALGHELVEPPRGGLDPPSRKLAADAALQGGWVPTVGRASPGSALSAEPAEQQAMKDLSNVFYLSTEAMADLDVDRGLHRTNMELVATRTSLLNECFY